MKNNKIKITHVIIFLLMLLFVLSSCTRIGAGFDPADIGYDIEVKYHALGGMINQREIRVTNYAKNSLVFSPAGTSNLLVAPERDGYTLAGWYTDVKELPADDEGNPQYEFDAQDRWDFATDRLEEDITLYARWVKKAEANYIDADTDEIVFSKNITEESPISELSPAIFKLINKTEDTFQGYYYKDLQKEYDFSQYEYSPLMPTTEELYEQLAKEFPRNIVSLTDKTVSDKKTDEIVTEENLGAKESDDALSQDLSEEIEEAVDENASEDTTWLFLNEVGYDMVATEDELAKIKYRKNEIIESYISEYEKNNAENNVYLVFAEGRTKEINAPEDIQTGADFTFSGLGEKGEYIIKADLDFSEGTFLPTDNFSGIIDGEDHILSNINLKLNFSKKDTFSGAAGALFTNLENAVIKNITFKDMVIEVSAPPRTDVQVAALAVNAISNNIENVTFDGLTIITGSRDDGSSTYEIADFILNNENTTVKNVYGKNVNLEVSEFAVVMQEFVD